MDLFVTARETAQRFLIVPVKLMDHSDIIMPQV
jgi:hypothetical protein